ncbi:hypothetical protein MAQ5080_01593 [Marinomonas aquimarina]|uniref:DUF1853 domain-containing protein n=1 Tax=Marinomonas aquimarina TaxID=295068 RepID=A0A1A8TBV9_9GAMM|nr:DUF1853 family protein [Marinomonas aquimarina]SBS30188.1 hypothetical protein MAQ5080_01593 [Marinomonas aquimarina]
MIYAGASLLADLEWLLQERESFVCDEPLSGFLRQDWRACFERLCADPTSLIAHMAAAKSHFLGTYFEQLFSFAVEHFTTLEVLAEHEQIQTNGKTLGEVDLVVRDCNGRVLQFEIALKFYLERPDLFPNHWIGPNKNDSLAKKVSHARQHQLAILHTPAGQEWLQEASLSTAVQPNLMIYGRHFYTLSEQASAFFSLAKHHSAWLRCSQLLTLQGYLCDLQEANKPNWITPATGESVTQQISATLLQTLAQRFDEDPRPVLFSCRHTDVDRQHEIFWLFVCPDNW